MIQMLLYFWLHPFFVSMTEITHNPKNKTLEVSVRIFTDDFEKALRKKCNCKVDLYDEQLKQAMQTQVQTYIENHIKILTGNKNAKVRFLGYEKMEESTWSYFEISNINQLKTVTIQNDLLLESNDKQMNMIHYKTAKLDKTVQLDASKKQVQF
jgi:hypothetical protein